MFKLRVAERFTINESGNICGSCWVLKVSNGFHDHEMINYAEGHRRRAAFDADEIEYIEKQVLAQVPPVKISLGLHMRTPDKPRPAMKQLYNIGAKIISEMRVGRNPAQHMLASATEAGYVQYREVNNETAQLTHIFMAHPEAIRMYRSYKFVVGIDSTYNTNIYKFPLVDIIGMTPTNQNFTIAYAIMEGESKEEYVWMLEKLGTLLPDGVSLNVIVTDRELGLMDVIPLVFSCSRNLLCVWHVNRAVEKRVNDTCKNMRRRNTSSSRPQAEVDMCKFFTSTCWYYVVYAVTDDQLTETLASMNEKWPSMVEYIETTWLVHREKFLRLYTNTSTHYGNTSTSRVESAYSVLKEWLHSAGLSVDTIWIRYHALMEGQHVEIKKALEDSRSKGKKDKYGRLFNLLKGKVSMYALGLMGAEFDRGTKLGRRLAEGCGHAIRTIHGLPCACELHGLSTRGRRVHLDSIDVFWRILVYDDYITLPPGDEGTLDTNNDTNINNIDK
ncbi:hypothetical protein RND81_12G011000 [Saponaria officinalis]|uniref:MULE transposase domain-containing protein n=1 Tax=Saponaria officinalis TaxID=3572 RepID=A0AAW1H668_SAPOF